MQRTRELYLEIVMELARENIMQDIMRSISGNNDLEFIRLSEDLADKMVDAEYALS